MSKWTGGSQRLILRVLALGTIANPSIRPPRDARHWLCWMPKIRYIEFFSADPALQILVLQEQFPYDCALPGGNGRHKMAGGSIVRLARKAPRILRAKGVPHFVRSAITYHKSFYYLHRTLGGGAQFEFQGETYPYFVHMYNRTWRNERAVEIPIALAWYERFRGRRVLEIGNVLSHYTDTGHDVVDKYERAAGVLNIDVVDYEAREPYDLVLAISTLEHVGWDEEVRDPGKIVRALERLKALLKPGGVFVATFPIGHNPNADALVALGAGVFTRSGYLARKPFMNPFMNRWREAAWDDVKDSRYNSPFIGAAAVAVAEFRN